MKMNVLPVAGAAKMPLSRFPFNRFASITPLIATRYPPLRVDSERGGVILFFAIMLFAIIALIGLVVDSGRLLVMQRQLQNAADAGSLSGVLMLRPPVLVDNWAKSKLAVLAIVKTANISGLDSAADSSIHQSPETFRLDGLANPPDCRETANDIVGYEYECGTRGNLTVRVSRGIWCYEAAPSIRRRWCSVEQKAAGGGPNPLWQLANSMRVDVTLRDIETTFAKIFLIDRIAKVSAQAISHLDTPTPSCGVARCADLGIPNPVDAGRLGGACE